MLGWDGVGNSKANKNGGGQVCVEAHGRAWEGFVLWLIHEFVMVSHCIPQHFLNKINTNIVRLATNAVMQLI